MPHCRTLAYPIGPDGDNYYARAWGAPAGATRRRLPRDEEEEEAVGQRVPLSNYPGVSKLAGKQVYVVKTQSMATEAVLRSWPAALRCYEANSVDTATRGEGPLSLTRGRRGASASPVSPRPPRSHKRAKTSAAPAESPPLADAVSDAVSDDASTTTFDSYAAGGSRCHWNADEDRALLLILMKLGFGSGARVRCWAAVAREYAKVDAVRPRSAKQCSCRWRFLDPARKDGMDAKRERRRRRAALAKEVDAELASLARWNPTLQALQEEVDLSVVVAEFSLDPAQRDAFALCAFESMPAPASAPAPSASGLNVRTAARPLRSPLEEEISVAHRYAFTPGLNLGRPSLSFAFSEPPPLPHRSKLHQQQQQAAITDYLLQRKALRPTLSPWSPPTLATAPAQKPLASAADAAA